MMCSGTLDLPPVHAHTIPYLASVAGSRCTLPTLRYSTNAAGGTGFFYFTCAGCWGYVMVVLEAADIDT